MPADFIVLEPGMRPYADQEPEITAIFDYWSGKRRDRRVPLRRDIDMVEIPPKVLPLLMLLDAVTAGTGRRFRYRLVGTTVVQYIGNDCTGRYLDEVIPAERAAVVLPSLHAAIDMGKPNTFEAPFAFPNRDFNYVRRIILPLSSNGPEIDLLMTCFVFKARPEAT